MTPARDGSAEGRGRRRWCRAPAGLRAWIPAPGLSPNPLLGGGGGPGRRRATPGSSAWRSGVRPGEAAERERASAAERDALAAAAPRSPAQHRRARSGAAAPARGRLLPQPPPRGAAPVPPGNRGSSTLPRSFPRPGPLPGSCPTGLLPARGCEGRERQLAPQGARQLPASEPPLPMTTTRALRWALKGHRQSSILSSRP